MFPDDLIPRATQILLPRWLTPDERSAWLAQAFFLAEPRLYNDLRVLDGQPIIILTNTITALLETGCLPNKKAHSLAQLLTSVRIVAPPEAQTEIDRLVPLLNRACADSKTITSTSVNKAISSLKVGKSQRPDKPLQSFQTPLAQRTPTVFISYSHEDNKFAMRLIDDLQDGGHSVWIDKMNIKGGAEWVRSIADGITNSYAFVSVLSPDANISRWVQREYLYADNLGKPIFPVMARPSEVPFQMIDRQVLSLVEDYLMGLGELLTVLPAPRVFTPTPEMIQAAPPPPKIIPFPAPAPQAPPMQSSIPRQPMPMPLSLGLPRKSAIPPMLLGLVGVVVVGIVGAIVLLNGRPEIVQPLMTQAPPISLTSVAMATSTVAAGISDVGNQSSLSGLLLPLIAVLVVIGVGLYLSRRKARPSTGAYTQPDFAPSRGGASVLADANTSPVGGVQPDKLKREESKKSVEAPMIEDGIFGGIPPYQPVAEAPIAPPVVDRRALELMYINRVAAERIDAMAEMDAPTPDDRVRVMRLGERGFRSRDSDWATVERQLPENGGAAALSMRRVMVIGDDLQDSLTTIWAAAAALTQRAMLDPTQPIPLVIDATRWPEGVALESFIESEMGELGAHLDDLLRDKRAALIFDGLYGLTPERMALVEFFINAHPDLMAVVDLTPP